MDKRVILARKLRKNQTQQEYKLWQILRNHKFHNLEFKRQYPMGDYIVDFICREKNLLLKLTAVSIILTKILNMTLKERNI